MLELRDKIGLPSGAPARGRRPPRPRPRRGAGRSARRWSAWAGRPSRPTTRSTGSPPEAGRRQPTCPACCGRRCGTLGRLSGARRARRATPRCDATARVVDPGGDDEERHGRGGAAAQAAQRVPRPDAGARPAAARARGGPAPRQRPRPRPAVRPARAGQDDPGDDRRRRDRAADPDHQRPGHPARRRPGRDPVLARRGRGALPRRDPPDGPPGRGDALPGDGGLPGRRHRRQGPRRHRDPAGARRRSPWSAPRPGPGCCRPRCATGSASPAHLDFYATADLVTHRASARPGCSASTPTTRASPRSPGAPGARRASPTGCCAGCATGPRCTAGARRPGGRARGAGPLRRRRPRASTGSTGRCSRRSAAGSAADRWACRTLAVAVGEESDTVETVAEPFLVREGFIDPHAARPGRGAAGLGAPRADAAVAGGRNLTDRAAVGTRVTGGSVGRLRTSRLRSGTAGFRPGPLVGVVRLT